MSNNFLLDIYLILGIIYFSNKIGEAIRLGQKEKKSMKSWGLRTKIMKNKILRTPLLTRFYFTVGTFVGI